MEIISQEGLRQDGRPATALRQMRCRLGVYDKPNGSAYLEMGNTKVLAAVYGPRDFFSTKQQSSSEAVIQCEVSRVAACREERVRRPRDQQTRAMSHQLASCFGAAIRKTKYPGSQIDINIQVLQIDGGLLSACINATTLALIHAGVEMYDYVSSCSSSIHVDEPLLDISHVEAQSGCELTLAMMPNKGKIVFLNISNCVHQSNLEKVMDLASEGCHLAYSEMHDEVLQFLKEKHAVMARR